VFAATLIVALSGCGMTSGSGDTDDSSKMRSIEETSNGPEPTLIGGGSRPPDSTLSYGGETVSGTLGTYCWINGCVDTVGIGASTDELTVPAGSSVTFAYGGSVLDSVGVAAYQIGRRNQPEKISGNIVLMSAGKGTELPVHQTCNQARITVGLPVGRYVVDVFATIPQGDASYGFLVAVE
jgi:hypothetical protein